MHKFYDNTYNKTKIVLQAAFGILENIFSIIFTMLLAKLTDFILTGDNDSFWRYGGAAAVIIVLQTVTLYLEYRFAYQCSTEYGRWLRGKIYRGLLYRKREELDRPNILNSYNSSIGELQGYISSIADYAVISITMMTAIVVMLRINVILLVISVMLIPLSGYLNKQVNNVLKRKNDIIFGSKEKINYNTKQILDGFYSIKAYGLENKFTGVLARDAAELEKLEKEKDKINSIQGRLAIALRYFPQLVIPLFGGWLCLNEKMTIGQLLAANTVIWYIIAPAEKLLELLKNRKLIQKNKEKIQELCLIPDNVSGTTQLTKIEQKVENIVEFKDVSFSYDKQRNVLQNMDFTIKRGEHMLIVGKSGEGKSTFVRLLCGQEIADSGSVFIDGTKIETGNADEVKKKIVFIPQDPFVFSGTMRENICIGNEVSEQKFREIIKASELEQFVDEQENGADTLIGEEGVDVSGGQKRRIALARALAADALIYIFDEPFSGLDGVTSVNLQNKLSDYLSDKTVLMISHQDITGWKHMYSTYRMMGGKFLYEK